MHQNTFIGHHFAARHTHTGNLVDFWEMSGGTSYYIRDRDTTLQSCGVDDVKDDMIEEMFFQHMYDTSLQHRYALNSVQPHVVHSYSPIGFVKLPLPRATNDWLRDWYFRNEHKEIKESFSGAVGTQHEVPWFVRHIPHELKVRLARELVPILAQWSQFPADELELTSCYGIRRYPEGAKLRMHVDTVHTHVVSVIINVDQENMRTDWPLEIKSHDGSYSYVTMVPGEMLLYESAKCLHGRPQALDGDSYANIFLHFKPSHESWNYDWY